MSLMRSEKKLEEKDMTNGKAFLDGGGWFVNCLYVAIAAAIGTSLLILIIVLINDLNLTGSAADWVASICNAVTAITAIAAFIVARSWLPQLTTQEGYKLAIRLVNEEILKLGEENLLKQNAHDAVVAFTTLQYHEQLVRGETVLSELSKVYKQADQQVKTIRNLEKQMATYGLKPAPDREKAFNDMMKALNCFAGLVRSEWVLLVAIARGGVTSTKIADLLNIDTYSLINSMGAGTAWTDLSKNQLQEMDDSWTRMINNQKAFLGTDSQIGKLFTVGRLTLRR